MNAAFAQPSTRQRRALLALLPACLLATAAVFEIFSAARFGSDVPSDSDWESGYRYLDSQYQEGDLVVAAPSWLDAKLRQFSAGRISLEMAARMDRERFGDVWVFSARGARAKESDGLEALSRREFGDLRVTRYAHKARAVVTDFLEVFSPAAVSGRWTTRPTVVVDEVGFEPRRCVRGEVAPMAHGAVLYRDVALGSVLVGYVGLADVFTRRDIRSSVAVSVTIDGLEVALLEVGVDDGWVRFEVPTPGKERGTVGFHPRAKEAKRLLCFAAEARR